MKGSVLFILILFLSSQLNAQEYARQPREKKKAFAKERFYLGGNFGLWFGTTTYIELSPLLGYKITERWHVGLGLTYIYFKGTFLDQYYNVYSINTSVYGGRMLTRFYIMENLFAHAEYEVLYLEAPVYDINTGSYVTQRKSVPGFLVGGGYSQKMGARSAFYIMVLYNLIYDPYYSPYTNPVVRMGFRFGL